MWHSTLRKECKEALDIKRYPEKLYAELIAFDSENGIFSPGWIACFTLDSCPYAIQRLTNTTGIEHQFVSVTEEELLMNMPTNQNLCCCVVGEVFVQLFRWGSRINALQKRPGRAMIGQKHCFLIERPFNSRLKGANES